MEGLVIGEPQATAVQPRAPRAIGALAVLALACGCTGGGSGDEPGADPSTEMTEVTISCDRFDDTAQRINDAQTALYDGKDSRDDAAVVDALVTELDALKDDAPEDVDAALTGLGEGFRSAQRLLEQGTESDRAELAELAPELAEDSQTVTAWIVSQCGG